MAAGDAAVQHAGGGAFLDHADLRPSTLEATSGQKRGSEDSAEVPSPSPKVKDDAMHPPSRYHKTITKFSMASDKPAKQADEAVEEPAVWTTKQQAAVIVPIWFIVGFAIFMNVQWHEDGSSLTAVDALYLQVQIVTTVGFGDMAPQHRDGRIFTALYVLTTVAVASGLIGDLLENMMTSQSETVRQQIAKEQKDDDDEPSVLEKYSSLIRSVLQFVGVNLIGVVFYWWVEDKTIADSFYMCIVTATTVGFGDVVPDTEEGRLFMTLWMFIGVAATASLVAVITDTLLKMKSEMKIHNLSEKLIEEIDASGDGEVSEMEFVCYMLKKYELVDQDLLQGFIENFRSLDKDGSGFLTANDLKDWAKERADHSHHQARTRRSVLSGTNSPRDAVHPYTEMPQMAAPLTAELTD
jgi:voltage-gated potassium channel Kch